jgi:hypothetical protein
MLSARTLTYTTVHISAIFYVAACTLRLRGKAGIYDRWSRLIWTLGCILYVTHVALAFHSFYHWSHNEAYRETARQTAALSGIEWGGGLCFNYLFTAIWIADTAWWWRGIEVYRRRARWIGLWVQGFMAFIFFNAVAVFPKGPARYMGIAATAWLIWTWWSGRNG